MIHYFPWYSRSFLALVNLFLTTVGTDVLFLGSTEGTKFICSNNYVKNIYMLRNIRYHFCLSVKVLETIFSSSAINCVLLLNLASCRNFRSPGPSIMFQTSCSFLNILCHSYSANFPIAASTYSCTIIWQSMTWFCFH